MVENDTAGSCSNAEALNEESRITLLREARALGIDPMIVTDVAVYVALTLNEIAEEWLVRPVELLAALSAAFPFDDKTGINWAEFKRKPGESFSDFMQRNLSKPPIINGDG